MVQVSLIFYSTGQKSDKISGNDKSSTLWLWTSLTITTLWRLWLSLYLSFLTKIRRDYLWRKKKTSRTFSVSGLLTKLEWWWRQRTTTIDPLSRPAFRSLHSTPQAGILARSWRNASSSFPSTDNYRWSTTCIRFLFNAICLASVKCNHQNKITPTNFTIPPLPLNSTLFWFPKRTCHTLT